MDGPASSPVRQSVAANAAEIPAAVGHPEVASPYNVPADVEVIFAPVLRPEDVYTEDGVYWADLPPMGRMAFVAKTEGAEARKEFASFWRMFKADPLSPVAWYFRNCVLGGAGLLLEGWVLFSIGILLPLLQAVWPECWLAHTVCSGDWISSVIYLEVLGITVGQLLVGAIGDMLGRRFGLLQDAIIMFLGLVWATFAWGVTLQGWVICYAFALFFYGIGVGGEYPMTATMAMETGNGSGRDAAREDRLHRGRKVTMAFLMQGWGQFLNQVAVILLTIVLNQSGNPPYGVVAAQWIIRLSFAIPAVGTLWLVYYRFYKMPEISKALNQSKKTQNVTGYDAKSLLLACKYFGPRLLATAGTWFCNDVFFYGNKLFQSEFIKVISPNSDSLMTGWSWNMVNCSVSLAGYYLAALLIDNKLYGRRKMQQVGFFVCFLTFVIPAFAYKYFTSPEHVRVFQALYFISSFFNQFGPNSVTFLIAAEVFPTSVRASAHGFSAAIGKLGALLASVLYNYIDTQTKFYVVPWFGLAGMLLTWLFLPDTTGLDLQEQDRRWLCLVDGREHDYHGVAVHPRHLSWWERFRGVGKDYDSKLDFDARVEEMRKAWEERQAQKARNESELSDDGQEDEYPPEVLKYFRRTSRASSSGGDSGGRGPNEKS